MASHPLITTFYPARGTALRRGLRPDDRHLHDGEEPALGSHLVTPRLGFAHHGIYIGGGRVVHYGAR